MLNSTEKPASASGGIVYSWKLIIAVIVLYISISYLLHTFYYNTIFSRFFYIFFFLLLLLFVDRDKVSI
ncbi:MAG TPA: hypothetical protein VN368_00015, partial [Candidatus Methylomirabilis sp.]|nr:hypothetical protein [Candidatus Methylomirabilis sp.]